MINEKREHIILIALACVLLGFILARQFYLYREIRKKIQPEQEKELALEVSQLIKSNAELRDELTQLQQRYDNYQKSYQDKKTAEKSIKDEINQYQIALGQKAVQGPGVSVQFSQKLSQTQLTDLINALRNIGCEAIALNDTRITPYTYWTDQTFKPPYNLQVIGDSNLIKEALQRRGGIMEQTGFVADVKTETNLQLPAAR